MTRVEGEVKQFIPDGYPYLFLNPIFTPPLFYLVLLDSMSDQHENVVPQIIEPRFRLARSYGADRQG